MARVVKGVSKATKSDSVTVRLDPKLRYLADIAARSQRRSLSAFIEWAVERALQDVQIRAANGEEAFVHELGLRIWDIDESDRFVKLAIHAPELLTYEEQKIWKLIRQYPFTFSIEPRHASAFEFDMNINYQNIRQHWGLIQSACFYDENSDAALQALAVMEKDYKVISDDVDSIPF